MKTIFYARVSTAEQTIDHQRTQAEAAGFKIDEVVADHVSGVSTRLIERPEGRRLFDMLRSGDTLVVRWVDRLGRNYADVTDTIREFMRRGVIIRTVISNMTFDGATTDPMQMAVRDAMIAFMAATAQAQAELTKVTQREGIRKAKESGSRYLGRKPSFTRSQLEAVLGALSLGTAPATIAREIGVSRQTATGSRRTLPDVARRWQHGGWHERPNYLALPPSLLGNRSRPGAGEMASGIGGVGALVGALSINPTSCPWL